MYYLTIPTDLQALLMECRKWKLTDAELKALDDG